MKKRSIILSFNVFYPSCFCEKGVYIFSPIQHVILPNPSFTVTKPRLMWQKAFGKLQAVTQPVTKSVSERYLLHSLPRLNINWIQSSFVFGFSYYKLPKQCVWGGGAGVRTYVCICAYVCVCCECQAQEKHCGEYSLLLPSVSRLRPKYLCNFAFLRIPPFYISPERKGQQQWTRNLINSEF